MKVKTNLIKGTNVLRKTAGKQNVRSGLSRVYILEKDFLKKKTDKLQEVCSLCAGKLTGFYYTTTVQYTSCFSYSPANEVHNVRIETRHKLLMQQI
jgi:hypothetical protein